MKNGGIAYLAALIAAISVAYLRLPSWRAFGLPLLSNPVITSCVVILPIIKPALLKFQTLLLQMLYLAFVCSTSSNQLLIRTGSLYRALCLSYARLNRILRLSVRLTKLAGYFCPTWPAPRAASSLSAILRTAVYVGANPRRSRSSI
jgi:hypothetical protein